MFPFPVWLDLHLYFLFASSKQSFLFGTKRPLCWLCWAELQRNNKRSATERTLTRSLISSVKRQSEER
uniref:Putative secreted peptide n=1 Tax=Anopheles braziliensis TaxID=58242 RepID=A0A2M3ZX54_9DIPT